MTHQEAIKMLQSTYDDFCQYDNPDDYYVKMLEARKMAIEALQMEPCDDTVSRHMVRDTIFEECSGTKLDIDFVKVLILQRAIKSLPPVRLKQKMGRWIVHPKGIYAQLVCDKCLSNAPYNCQTNYCPNCGAKMSESEE